MVYAYSIQFVDMKEHNLIEWVRNFHWMRSLYWWIFCSFFRSDKLYRNCTYIHYEFCLGPLSKCSISFVICYPGFPLCLLSSLSFYLFILHWSFIISSIPSYRQTWELLIMVFILYCWLWLQLQKSDVIDYNYKVCSQEYLKRFMQIFRNAGIYFIFISFHCL